MTYYYRLSLATKEARRLHGVTGLEYHVVTYDGEKWFVVRETQPDMAVWRTISKKINLFS